ncbi:MAG: DUF1254 domain-containing protein [Pseudomonadota bacterium]
MIRWIGPLAVFMITAVGAHWATLAYAPSVIMDRALSTMKNRGISEHAFTTPQRITPQTQAVVRSSPDLFYSLCRYDLIDAESVLRVTMGEWSDYQSLSFFDGNTNNFHRVRGEDKSVEVQLVGPGSTREGSVQSPTAKGIVLIRRLAPTQALFDQAKQVAAGDGCELIAP